MNSATDSARRLRLPWWAQEALICLSLLLLGWLWLPSAGTLEEQPATLDEIGWLSLSHHTYGLFFGEDCPALGEVDWKEGLQSTTYGAMNPNLAKLVFGANLAHHDYDLPAPEVFPALHPGARGKFRKPHFIRTTLSKHEPYLMHLRDLNVWLMAFAGIFLFRLGTLLHGRTLGFLSWALFLSTPRVHELAPLVMTDNLLVLLLVLSTALTGLVLSASHRESLSQGKRLLAMLGLGVLFGLATSTKLNGALTCFVFGAAALSTWLLLRPKSYSFPQLAADVGAAAFGAVATFLLLYPMLWSDPFGGVQFILERWDQLIANQQRQLDHVAIDGVAAQFSAVYHEGLGAIGPGWLHGSFLALLALFGLADLLVDTFVLRRNPRRRPVQVLVICASLLWLLGTAFWIPLDWSRYYLPVIPFACLLVAYCLLEILMLTLKRLPARTGTAAALCCILGLGSCSDEPIHPTAIQASKPHILLLTVDTLRPDYLGMYGYDRDSSPYLDSLLKEAFHFDKTLASVPRTTPAVASLMTGGYPHTTGVRRLLDPLKAEMTPIAELLQAKGYRTGAVVTQQMLGKERGLARGFETYDWAKDRRVAMETTQAGLRWMETMDFSEPVLMWAHYIDPHMPYVSDPAIIASFDPGYSGRYAKNFGQFHTKGRTRSKGPYPPELPKAQAVHANPLPEDVVAHIRRLYAADIRATDDAIRVLVEEMMERTGGDLLIVFTSDHGESLGEHDFHWDHGDYVYNAAGRIPFAILPPPGHPARRAGSLDQWVSIVDVVPTLLELLGISASEMPSGQIDGRSLVPAMLGQELDSHPVFLESGRSHFFDMVRGRAANTIEGRFRAVVSDGWKLIWAPGHTDAKLSWKLFHVDEDPHETVDLFRKDHPQVVRLRELLAPWAEKSLGFVSEREPTAEELEMLNELGYVESGPH